MLNTPRTRSRPQAVRERFLAVTRLCTGCTRGFFHRSHVRKPCESDFLPQFASAQGAKAVFCAEVASARDATAISVWKSRSHRVRRPPAMKRPRETPSPNRVAVKRQLGSRRRSRGRVRCDAARPEGFEPPTFGSVDRRSIQLRVCPLPGRRRVRWCCASDARSRPASPRRSSPLRAAGRGGRARLASDRGAESWRMSSAPS